MKLLMSMTVMILSTLGLSECFLHFTLFLNSRVYIYPAFGSDLIAWWMSKYIPVGSDFDLFFSYSFFSLWATLLTFACQLTMFNVSHFESYF